MPHERQPLAILRQLAAHGLRLGATFALAAERDTAQDDPRQERVRFPVEAPLPRPGRVISFGVAAAVIHPATGYSVASALDLAPRVAASIASALPHGPASASTAARHRPLHANSPGECSAGAAY